MTEKEMFCAICQDTQTFHELDGGWQCDNCGHFIMDEYEAQSDEDCQIEEEDWF